jgi:hypothetical protein
MMMSQNYTYEQAFSFNAGIFQGSQSDFWSDLSTHPSTYYQNYAGGPDSASTSELGSARAASFLTPSTPTNSNDGDVVDHPGEASPSEHQSPNDSDRALQGISGSNCEINSLV